MRIWALLAVCAIGPAGEVAHAHHSIAGYYDSSRRMRIEGVVTAFQFVSPHPMLDIRDSRTSQVWRVEMDNRRELEAIGVTADSLKAGDQVVVTGSLARREPHRMYIQRLDRPADGFGFEQVNSRPRRVR